MRAGQIKAERTASGSWVFPEKREKVPSPVPEGDNRPEPAGADQDRCERIVQLFDVLAPASHAPLLKRRQARSRASS